MEDAARGQNFARQGSPGPASVPVMVDAGTSVAPNRRGVSEDAPLQGSIGGRARHTVSRGTRFPGKGAGAAHDDHGLSAPSGGCSRHVGRDTGDVWEDLW